MKRLQSVGWILVAYGTSLLNEEEAILPILLPMIMGTVMISLSTLGWWAGISKTHYRSVKIVSCSFSLIRF